MHQRARTRRTGKGPLRGSDARSSLLRLDSESARLPSEWPVCPPVEILHDLVYLALGFTMSKKTTQTEWSRNVRRRVRNFAHIGIQEAPSTRLFQWCEHVTVSVEGLDGIGVIHQHDASKPF